MAQLLKRLTRVSAAAAATAAATQTAAWIASRRTGRVNVVDVAWGPGLAGIAAASAAVGGGDRLRRALLMSAVTAWGTRLAVHVHRSAAGRGEDPRYARMLAGKSPAERFFKVFVTQGAAQWVISLPIQVSAVATTSRGRLARATLAAGTALMAGGGLIEALADRQKAAWKQDPEHGPVMDQGLWAWSRHPNYFGDATFWWGAYLVAASGGKGWSTIFSPAVMTWFLIVGTGAKPAERLRRGDAAYADYQRRVAFFVPRPPR